MGRQWELETSDPNSPTKTTRTFSLFLLCWGAVQFFFFLHLSHAPPSLFLFGFSSLQPNYLSAFRKLLMRPLTCAVRQASGHLCPCACVCLCASLSDVMESIHFMCVCVHAPVFLITYINCGPLCVCVLFCLSFLFFLSKTHKYMQTHTHASLFLI